MTPEPRFTGMTTLDLYPVIVKGRADQYVVISRQGRQAISTGKAGVEAIRLLGSGRTVDHARRILARRYRKPPEDIDLAPLVETLLASGFVRSLDGQRFVGAGSPRPRGFGAGLPLPGWSGLLELALRLVPPRVSLFLAYRWFAPPSNPDPLGRIEANLRRAPALPAAAPGLARIAASHHQALRKQFCDRLLLASLPLRRLRGWLRAVPISGLEHLERARAERRGAILCALHLGSYSLIPCVLAARGFPVAVYAGFDGSTLDNLTEWLGRRDSRHDPWPLRIVGGPLGLRTLAQSLDRGETVLLYCDPVRRADAPRERSGLIPVPFLGTRVWTARGAAWLHLRSGAPLLPAALRWRGVAGHRLDVGPAIPVSAAGGREGAMDGVMSAIFGALERPVRQHPEQWLRWHEFDRMIVT